MAHELWLHRNVKAKNAVERGLAQAKAHEFSKNPPNLEKDAALFENNKALSGIEDFDIRETYAAQDAAADAAWKSPDDAAYDDDDDNCERS